MSATLDPAQRRDALIAALDWVGAYEGTHPADGKSATIEQGARDVPQDLLDAYVLLQDLVDQQSRSLNRAAFLALARADHPTAPDKVLQRHATDYSQKMYPEQTYERLTKVSD